jgi:hypothetical protein
MGVDKMREILAAHADELVARGTASPVFTESSEQPEAQALMEVAAHAKHALQPIPPTPAFRARLHDGLTLAARHQQAHVLSGDKRSEPAWGWLIGAAALGSAAGVLAVVLRSRTQTHKTAAPAQVQN